MKIKPLYRKVFESVTKEGDLIVFKSKRGKSYRMGHQQDCCEQVSIHDMEGGLSDLQGYPLLQADEETSHNDPKDIGIREYQPESMTWTFYRFSTIKGSVVIRWCGESNGYYSESVDIEEIL